MEYGDGDDPHASLTTKERARHRRLMRDSPNRQCRLGQVSPRGHERAVLLLLCGCATLLTWPGTVPATLDGPRQAERYPCFTVLIAALIEAEDGNGRDSRTRVLAS